MNRFYHNFYIVFRPILRILFPLRIVGADRVPAGAAVICPNHANAFDPVLVAISLPNDSRLAFMAKEELFRRRPVAWLLSRLGAFPVKRGGNDLAAMKTAMKQLQEGGRLLVFPEGTRVEQKGQVEAKGGVALIAARTGAPMVPVFCGGRKKLFRRNTVVFGEPYAPVFSGRRPTAEELQKAADELMDRVYAMKEVDGWK